MKEEKPIARKMQQSNKTTLSMKAKSSSNEKKGWSTLNLYEMIWELELASHPRIPTK
jgi:hypothetical protein